MKRILSLLITLIFTCTSAFALEIVYPKTNPTNVNASSTFFIGSTTPGDVLKINDKEVKVSPSGAFAQVVSLNYGANSFKIISAPTINSLQTDSNCINTKPTTIDFSITRPRPTATTNKVQPLIEYPIVTNFYTKKDNSPLRKTPADVGINRMANLPKDMQLLINGEKAGFYRVYLGSNQSGWVAKSDVEQRGTNNCESLSVKMIDYNMKEDDDFCVYEYNLERGVPFELSEENGLTLRFFNIDGSVDNTYTINLSTTKLMGYDAYYENNKFTLKVRKTPCIRANKPLKRIIISVDAGHGGNEFGAIGCGGDKEKDINLAIAKKLQCELTARDAKVIMTREDDTSLSLADRVKFAKDNNALISISIHANAIPDGADPNKNRGTSVYYYHNQAKSLAENILTVITTELGTQNDKVRQASLALVRSTACVSVLIEVAYIINPDDYELLLDKNFQINCAKAIADGIENYLKN